MRAIILTAGNGTRIRAISHCRSKCMLPVQGRPLLAWHLDRCVDSGQVDAIHMVTLRRPRYSVISAHPIEVSPCLTTSRPT